MFACLKARQTTLLDESPSGGKIADDKRRHKDSSVKPEKLLPAIFKMAAFCFFHRLRLFRLRPLPLRGILATTRIRAVRGYRAHVERPPQKAKEARD